MTASVHNLRRKRMLAATLLAIFGHDTQYNEERCDLRDFFISESKNQAWRCRIRHTLPGCGEILTEKCVTAESEDHLIYLFGSNMAYVNKRAYRVPTSQRVAQKRPNHNSWQRNGREE